MHWSEFAIDDFRAIQFMHFGSATAMLPSENSQIGASRETYFRLLEWARANQVLISFDANYRETLWQGKIGEFVRSAKRPFLMQFLSR